MKIPSGLFSLVEQYFDVSADVEAAAGVGVADAEVVEGVGVADVEAVDGVKAGNVKSRWIYLYLMYLPIYPPPIRLYLSVDLFLCLSIYLYIVSSTIWTICNLYFFSHISTILSLLYLPLRQQIEWAYFTTYIGKLPPFFTSWWFLVV